MIATSATRPTISAPRARTTWPARCRRRASSVTRRAGPAGRTADSITASDWPLQGVHAAATCSSCHTNNVYKGTSRDCYTCHQTQYQQTKNPNHSTAGFSTACEACHRNGGPGWLGASVNHAQFWPLLGSHNTTACSSCHKSDQYKGTSRDCSVCHQGQYQQTKNPNHTAAGFSTACDACHKNGGPGWLGASISHTQFWPLLGSHNTTACASCHTNNVYKGTSRDCSLCHQTQYQQAQNPNHAASGFPTTCDQCHKNGGPGWKGASFDHNQAWPLQGSHSTATCASCHKNNVYKGTPRDCYSCHQVHYQQTKNPNHTAAGFSTACDACHKNGGPGWLGASINHAQFWPLLGSHNTTACASCHKNNVYKGTSRDCYVCHQGQYQQAQNPNHASGGFPTTCEQCHKNGGPGWKGATFNHSQYFALQGVHSTQPCSSCHKNNIYKGTPRDCAGCHLSNYQATRNPNHVAAGFPTTCDTCHRVTDTSWSQGRFDHTWFPITSGKHAGNACSACHQDSNNYKSFTCLTCHDRAKMDDKHKGRAGYRYDSAACYSCHPTGRGD